jgi:hypothetical protein
MSFHKPIDFDLGLGHQKMLFPSSSKKVMDERFLAAVVPARADGCGWLSIAHSPHPSSIPLRGKIPLQILQGGRASFLNWVFLKSNEIKTCRLKPVKISPSGGSDVCPC